VYQQSEGVYRRSKFGRDPLSTPATSGIHPHVHGRHSHGIGCITSRPSTEQEYEAWLRGVTIAQLIEEQKQNGK
jgi:hypothetical protein